MFHVLSCTALLLTVDLEKMKLLFLALSAEKMKKEISTMPFQTLPVMSPRSNTFLLRHGSQFLRKDKIVKSGRNLEHACGFRRWNGVN